MKTGRIFSLVVIFVFLFSGFSNVSSGWTAGRMKRRKKRFHVISGFYPGAGRFWTPASFGIEEEESSEDQTEDDGSEQADSGDSGTEEEPSDGDKAKSFHDMISDFYSGRFFPEPGDCGDSQDSSTEDETEEPAEEEIEDETEEPAEEETEDEIHVSVEIENVNFTFSTEQLEAIEDVLSVFSADVLDNIEVIMAKSGDYLGATTVVDGDKGSIYLSDTQDIDTFKYTLFHEVGHIVDLYTADENSEIRAAIDEFKELFDDNEENFVSTYAMTNEEEDFAETLASYICYKEEIMAQAQALAAEGNDVLLQKLEIIEDILNNWVYA